MNDPARCSLARSVPGTAEDADPLFDTLIAEARSGADARGIRFDPADYASEEEMMNAVEALLLRWWEEEPEPHGA